MQQPAAMQADDAAEPVAAVATVAAMQVDDAAEPVAAVAAVAAMQADDAAEPVAAVATVAAMQADDAAEPVAAVATVAAMQADDAAEPVAAVATVAAMQVDDAAEPVAAVATVAAMQADDAAEPVAAVATVAAMQADDAAEPVAAVATVAAMQADDAAEPVAAVAAVAAMMQVDDAAEPVAAVAAVAAMMQVDDAAEPVAAVSVFQVDPDNNGMGSLSKQEIVAEANERLKRQKQARKLEEAAAFEQHLEAERHMIEEYEREAEREAEKERQTLRLCAAWRKQTKEQPWMQAENGPSGTRIEDVTAETAEATRLEFEIRHGRNSVHMVGKKDNAVTSVVTTTPKCLMGGGGSGSDGTVYPILLPMEKVIKNQTLVQRRQRIIGVTGGSRCKGVDAQDLKQMSEEDFEQLLQEMAVAQQKKMQAEADEAEERAAIASMDWLHGLTRMSAQLCGLMQRLCGKLDVPCWILGAKDDSEGESEDDHIDDPMGRVRGAQQREERQTRKKEMRKAMEDAANEKCPVTQHVEASREKAEAKKGQVMTWQRQSAELKKEALIQEAQKFICGDCSPQEGVGIGCEAEMDAMYAEARRRIRVDITGMIERGESEMTCLAAATQRAEKARRTVRAYEAELCAMFEARNAAELAEDMTLLTETMEGPEEAEVGVLKDVLEMADKVEAYKTWSEAAMATATDLMQTAVRRHADGGGCDQCTGGGPEPHVCVSQEISDGEMRKSQETYILYDTLDVTRLKKGRAAECRNIWLEGAETGCQDGNCLRQRGDEADTTARADSGQGAGQGRTDKRNNSEARRMGRFEGASAIEVFRWVTRHMIEDLGQRILQVVAGKGITGAQIEQAMSSQTIEGCVGALSELFEYKPSQREIRALETQLREADGFENREPAGTTRGKKARKSGETEFCCLWREGAWNEQCDSCKMKRGARWKGQQEIMERLWRQMSDAIEAAGVTSREQMFFASRVERAMQLDVTSEQGTVEQSEDEGDMFRRFQIEYEMTGERETVKKETRDITRSLERENITKSWFDESDLGPEFETVLRRGVECYCEASGYLQMLSSKHAVPYSEEEKSVKCHLCEEKMEGVKPKTRVEMSLDAIQGRMVVIEIEQTSRETPFYVLRYMDPETQTFGTFTPARDSYSIFAVAMKMAQIASGTRGALRKKLRRATAFSKPRPHLNNTAVGADNVMQVVELGEMSEYIHEAEREEDGEGREGERWPDIRGSSTQRQKGQLKMITDLLKTEVRGEVRATRECKWIRGWARQWDLEVTHYKYARKNQPSPMEQDGRQGEGCAGERLTRVEYTESTWMRQCVRCPHLFGQGMWCI